MPIKVTPAEIQNLQQMEVVVAGPDDANRLFIIDGQFDAQVLAQAGVQKKETFAILVGPVFTSKQFRRAIAMASLTKTGLGLHDSAGGREPAGLKCGCRLGR